MGSFRFEPVSGLSRHNKKDSGPPACGGVRSTRQQAIFETAADVKGGEMRTAFMGIDPGRSGAVIVIDALGCRRGEVRLNDTDHDVCEFVRLWSPSIAFAALEQVNAMPGQGVASTFKFGLSYGFCAALLAAFQVPHDLVRPAAWQKAMGCRTGGDKNVSKQAAQRLFPGPKIIHANADAFLLAEFARRIFNARAGNH